MKYGIKIVKKPIKKLGIYPSEQVKVTLGGYRPISGVGTYLGIRERADKKDLYWVKLNKCEPQLFELKQISKLETI